MPALHMVFVVIRGKEDHATDTASGAVSLFMVRVAVVLTWVVDPSVANIAFDMVFFWVECFVVVYEVVCSILGVITMKALDAGDWINCSKMATKVAHGAIWLQAGALEPFAVHALEGMKLCLNRRPGGCISRLKLNFIHTHEGRKSVVR